MDMEIKCFCPFWEVCGPAPIHQLCARREFPCGDPRRDYVAMVCNDENEYLKCEHYKIRANQRRWRKMKLSGIWNDVCLWRERKKPILQLAVWIVGIAIIVFFTAKEFYEKMLKK